MLKVFPWKETQTIHNHVKGKMTNGTYRDNSNQIGSQNFHLLKQYLQQMRKRLHERLDALYVVENLERQ
jgi:hypothetical protein